MMLVVRSLRMLMGNPRFRTVTLLAAVLAVAAALVTGSLVAEAQEQAGGVMASDVLAKALGAGLAVGLAGIGGGYAVGVAGAAAVSAVAENREISGTVLLYVALGEGIAIYGLLVALIILFVL